MKKIITLLISFIFVFTCGCAQSMIGQDDLTENLPITKPVPPEEDDEERRKTYILSNANGIRIRSGAGTNYSVIGQIEKNDMLSFKGKAGNYYITTYKEKTGYIHADYCSLVEFGVASEQVEKAITFGTELLGYPYVWGSERYHWGNGVLNKNFVNGEFDCSAFVQYVYYKTNNVLLEVTSRAQSTEGELVDKKDLKRGDLMFFTNASRKDKVGIEKVGHVGIYFGDNYILHTASDYAVLEPISATRWSYYLHSRRVV